MQKKIDKIISSIPWVKRIVDRVRKDTKELKAENTESTIDFDSKTTLASTTLNYNAAMISTS
jgi:hypothetical protein